MCVQFSTLNSRVATQSEILSGIFYWHDEEEEEKKLNKSEGDKLLSFPARKGFSAHEQQQDVVSSEVEY